MSKLNRFRYVLVVLGIMFLMQCGSTPFDSVWIDQPMSNTGDMKQWESIMQYAAHDHMGIGVANDTHFLYLCLICDNRRDVLEIVRTGITVWFLNQKNQKWGIHYPIGIAGTTLDISSTRTTMVDTITQRQRMETALQRLEIITEKDQKKKDTVLMDIVDANTAGLTLTIVPFVYKLIYQLKIPLSSDSTSLYGVKPDDQHTIQVCLEGFLHEFNDEQTAAPNNPESDDSFTSQPSNENLHPDEENFNSKSTFNKPTASQRRTAKTDSRKETFSIRLAKKPTR